MRRRDEKEGGRCKNLRGLVRCMDLEERGKECWKVRGTKRISEGDNMKDEGEEEQSGKMVRKGI